jgi:iron complex outermembrane receptor protein
MNHFKRTSVSVAALQAVLAWPLVAAAQTAEPTAPAPAASQPASATPDAPTVVVVTGQRRALQTAQKIKQNAEEIVDSVVAEDIGKLPDRSVTEVLQRVTGVTMDRTQARSDPVHYSVEGSGVIIRGLTYVAAQLNGRETFSANGGRSLGFEDVPPELMTGVDVYKNPSAEQIEGAIGGLVNLRTALPLDSNGFHLSANASRNYDALSGTWRPQESGLISNVWDTGAGKFGALLDLAHSTSSTRTDKLTVDPYYMTTTSLGTNSDGKNLYAPDGTGHWYPGAVSWGTQEYERKRDGIYGALQWKKDDMESSLTFFRSKFDTTMLESNVSNTPQPYGTKVSNATWSAGGLMLTGELSNPSQGGLEAELQTRYARRQSQTQDISWNFNWRASDRWDFSSDLQLVRSHTKDFDSEVATAILLPKETIDLTGRLPSVTFDSGDQSTIANQSNYYWATTMEHLDRGTATQKAGRLDARYSFDNNPVLSDVRFGVRFVERQALTVNSDPSYNWATVTHAWQQYWDIPAGGMAYVTKFSDPTSLKSFGNFMGGRVSLPSMYFPALSVARGWPNSYASLHNDYKQVCSGCYQNWTPAVLSADPNSSGYNDQKEHTLTGYGQLRFALDDLRYPVDGNVGLRVIHTEEHAFGHSSLTVQTPPTGANGNVPDIAPYSKAEEFANHYNNFLPSLNVRVKQRSDLQYRFALSKGISRPGLDQLQAYQTMTMSPVVDSTTNAITSVTMSGSASGNPLLKPVQSVNEDVTAEWYANKDTSLTVAAFNKELKDIIINQTFTQQVNDSSGTPYDFVVTGPVNGARGRARGFEMGFQTRFDKLPGLLSGIGLQANYTYVDSMMHGYNAVPSTYCSAGAGASNLNLFANGCDTDGRSFGNTPLPNLSRNTFNLALLYDQGGFSARVAYSWRERYLYGVALNSDNTGPNQQNGLNTNPASATYQQGNLPIGLPLWAESYGQLDAGVQYKVSDHLTLSLQGTNLTDALYKQLMQQHVGMLDHNYFTSGRRYSVSLQYSY